MANASHASAFAIPPAKRGLRPDRLFRCYPFELLGVIAIIAVLAAFLSPGLKRAKRLAKGINCEANQKGQRKAKK